MSIAPIALFIYNRPEHTRRTIEALARNDLSERTDMYVFCDGAKTETESENVAKARECARKAEGFKSVTLIERERNLGLAGSITSGVTEMLNTHDRVIVVEDDIVTSPYFLRYMNDGLELYEGDERVISIHGYIYPVTQRLPETFFLRGADCWGWATWKRGWDLFEEDGTRLLGEMKRKGLSKKFDFNGAYRYTAMLEARTKGQNDSWAILWHASAFLKEKLTLYPGRSLVQNIGLDNSGTHCGASNDFETQVSAGPVEVRRIPVEESRLAVLAIEAYFNPRFSLKRSLLRIARSILACRGLRG